MSTQRGRPRKHNYDRIEEIVYRNKDSIKVDDGRIRSKTSEIWMTMSQQLKKDGILMPASSLYSFVSCNTNNIRDKIIGQHEIAYSTDEDLKNNNETDIFVNSINLVEETTSIFEVHLSRKEFEEMLVRKKYNNKQGAEYVCKIEEITKY